MAKVEGDKIIYNKAVRDRIPEIIQEEGKTATVRIIEDKIEYKNLLEEKLEEELVEYKESGKVEELADLVEVVYGILDMSGVTLEEFEVIRQRKNEKRGAFRDRVFLVEVKPY